MLFSVITFLPNTLPSAHLFCAGFSFSGEVREPFPKVIEALRDTKIPVLAVDAPSSWDIENGPPESGPGKGFHPQALISLTAAKPLVKHFKGRHFVGGRYVAETVLLANSC
jgi:NAD(P)H-hydrate epimerase